MTSICHSCMGRSRSQRRNSSRRLRRRRSSTRPWRRRHRYIEEREGTGSAPARASWRSMRLGPHGYVENLMEHAFLSELLQYCWFVRHHRVEVIRPAPQV
jgi:hypothetical protein